MTRLAHLITGSNLAAQDLVHDAFVKVSGRLDQIETPAAYLRVTVVNECRSWLRHRVVVDRHDRAQTADGLVEPEPAIPAELGRVWRAMHRLPERQRVAVVLRHWSDLPVAEVADLMGCAQGTVKSLCTAPCTPSRRSCAMANPDHHHTDADHGAGVVALVRATLTAVAEQTDIASGSFDGRAGGDPSLGDLPVQRHRRSQR